MYKPRLDVVSARLRAGHAFTITMPNTPPRDSDNTMHVCCHTITLTKCATAVLTITAIHAGSVLVCVEQLPVVIVLVHVHALTCALTCACR